MKFKIFLLVLAISLTGISRGVSNNRKANRYFELYKYAKAIPLYKKSVEKGSEAEKREATFRLADCYRMINDVKEARSWYARGIDLYEADPVHYFYLGQALRSLEEYDEAEKAFLKYAELNSSDERGDLFARYSREIQELEMLDETVEIRNATPLNSKYYDFAPVFYQEGVLFTSDRSSGMTDESVYEWTNYGYLDLYYSTPDYFRDFWTAMSPPKRMSDVFNQTWHDGPVSFSADGQTIFLTRTTKSKVRRDENNFRTSLLKIYVGEVSGKQRVAYEPFPYNSETYSVGHPTVSADGSKLIFSSDMFGGFGGSDLYVSEKTDGQWSKPQNLGPKINTFGNEVFPFWFNDTTLYFSSDGHFGYGGLDIFEAQWKDGGWQSPENMRKPLNSSSDDFGIVFHKEKNDGFFSSNRPGGKGADDIYAIRNYTKKPARKEKEKEIAEEGKWTASGLKVCGYVKEKGSLLPLDNATVFAINSLTHDVLVLKTDEAGYYCIPVENDVLYVAKAMKPGFFDDCLNFRFFGLDSAKNNPVPRDLLLDRYEVNKIFAIENIYYDLDKWHIRPDAKPSLDRVVQLMKEYPIAIELSSHTDSRASQEYNDILSQKRAEAAVRYITLKGVNPVRMVAQGYGENKLINRCADGVPCSEKEHQANRRTEFKILDTASEYFDKEPFNPDIFKAGEKIAVQVLDPDFFKGCLLQERNVGSTVQQPVPVTPELARATPDGGGTVKTTLTQVTVYTAESGKTQSGIQSVPVVTQGNSQLIELDGSSPETGTFFTVQIFANLIPLDMESAVFKGETGIFEKRVGEYYKYFAGMYGTYNEAAAKRRQLASKFNGCFVVGFMEGTVVPSGELKAFLKQ